MRVMFGEFIKRLTQPEPVALADADARLALCALLVRIARADHDYSDVEKQRIDDVLRARFALNDDDARALRAQGEIAETEAPDTVRFTRAIKEAVAYEDRLGVVQAMWQIALADGGRAQEEDAIVRLASNFLGVTDRDSALARQGAQAKS